MSKSIHKNHNAWAPGAVFTTLHFLLNGPNKLECLPIACLFRLVRCNTRLLGTFGSYTEKEGLWKRSLFHKYWEFKQTEINNVFSLLQVCLNSTKVPSDLSNKTFFASNKDCYMVSKGIRSTIYLLVQTSLDQLLFILKILFIFLKKYLNEEVNCTNPSPSVSIPWLSWRVFKCQLLLH